jgi:hypothetical protein
VDREERLVCYLDIIRSVLFQPEKNFFGIARVGGKEIAALRCFRRRKAENEDVVKDEPGIVANDAVVSAAIGDLRYVPAHDVLKQGCGVCTPYFDPAEAADIEKSRCGAHGMIFILNVGELERNLPSLEFRHLRF